MNLKHEPQHIKSGKSNSKIKIDGLITGDKVSGTDKVNRMVEGIMSNVFVDSKTKTIQGKCAIEEPGY